MKDKQKEIKCQKCDFLTVNLEKCPYCGYNFNGKNSITWKKWFNEKFEIKRMR